MKSRQRRTQHAVRTLPNHQIFVKKLVAAGVAQATTRPGSSCISIKRFLIRSGSSTALASTLQEYFVFCSLPEPLNTILCLVKYVEHLPRMEAQESEDGHVKATFSEAVDVDGSIQPDWTASEELRAKRK
jgi:hypothetical protein